MIRDVDYSIYQLKNDKIREKGFIGLDMLKRKNIKIEPNDYDNVYSGKTSGVSYNAALEGLFETFNVNHPADFKGHSLSVSDVVVINGNAYYCDNFGWTKLEDWKI